MRLGTMAPTVPGALCAIDGGFKHGYVDGWSN
jgi:hypothetical protein